MEQKLYAVLKKWVVLPSRIAKEIKRIANAGKK